MPKNHRQGPERPGSAPAYSVSQNFLTSRRLIERLIRLAGLKEGDPVLEIGAGKGHITRALADAGCHVTAVEIDPRLCASLRESLRPYPGAVLKQGDFLQMPLPRGGYTVFANLPFNHTSAILRRLTASRTPPKDAWLVIEKGAALRFCGIPYESKNSLLLKPYFQTEIVYFFRREDFHPSPSVDAVMLHLSRRDDPDLTPGERRAFSDFIDHVQRYGLTGARGPLTKKQAATALRLAGLPPLKPSGTMQYVQWLCLFRCSRRFGALAPSAGTSRRP
ncbi:MAG TPA: methyltransferase domain-containing protein [Firmicutes bacterium]|nr:methyltransferase domain-containing protein [Bacillota bacterium]